MAEDIEDLRIVNELKEKEALEIVFKIDEDEVRTDIHLKNKDYIQGRIDQDPLFALHLFDEFMHMSKGTGKKKKTRTTHFSDILYDKFGVNIPKLVQGNKSELNYTNFYSKVPENVIEKYEK